MDKYKTNYKISGVIREKEKGNVFEGNFSANQYNIIHKN